MSYTEAVARQLATDYAADPAAELEAWLGMAEQREAMVVQVYALNVVRSRLPTAGSDDARNVGEVAAKAMGGIWTQETSHTELLNSLRRLGGIDDARKKALQGSLEGLVTSLATGHGLSGVVARWLIGIGRALNQAPEFTAAFTALSFGDFCRFSRELELTAAQGYERIDELQQRVEADAISDDLSAMKYGLFLRYEVQKTLAEERFHAAVLQRIPEWLEADGGGFRTDKTVGQRVAELRYLGRQHLSWSSLSKTPAGPVLEAVVRPDTRALDPWVSAGGLGDLFAEHAVMLEVIPEPTGKTKTA